MGEITRAGVKREGRGRRGRGARKEGRRDRVGGGRGLPLGGYNNILTQQSGRRGFPERCDFSWKR